MDNDTLIIQVTGPSTMAAGRQSLQRGLREWGSGNIANVVLVFSELVTNAAVHTAAASTTVITNHTTSVRIEVHDLSHSIPQLRPEGHPRPGGFGLRIVSELSDSWGWDQTPTGKIVWSIMPTSAVTLQPGRARTGR